MHREALNFYWGVTGNSENNHAPRTIEEGSFAGRCQQLFKFLRKQMQPCLKRSFSNKYGPHTGSNIAQQEKATKEVDKNAIDRKQSVLFAQSVERHDSLKSREHIDSDDVVLDTESKEEELISRNSAFRCKISAYLSSLSGNVEGRMILKQLQHIP